VNKSGLLKFLTGERTGFGGENAPHGFGAKVTRGANHSVDEALDRAGTGYELQDAYRRELAKRGAEDFVAPDMTVLRKRGCCVLRGDDIWGSEKEEGGEACEEGGGAAEGGESEGWHWGALRRGLRLTAEEPLMEPGPSVSRDGPGRTSCNATYLDDCFGLFILFAEANGGRRAHAGEEYSTNKEQAMAKFLRRTKKKQKGDGRVKGIEAAMEREKEKKEQTGVKGRRMQTGEDLRARYVRGTLEEGGLKVVCDQKSQKKYDGGACNEVQEILGMMYDARDPTNPLTGLPEGKQKELRARLRILYECCETEVDHDEVESVAHKLSAAAMATARGGIYLGGFFEALQRKRGGKGKKIFYTRWLRRNVGWWLAYFDSGAPRMRILVPTPNLSQKFCPHTDASTKWGFGGHWIKNEPGGAVCYYIQGAWTESERRLIDSHEKVGIAFLEMAAVDFLLASSRAVGFEGKSFSFYCDNQNAINILTSYKSRTLPLSLLLESIDRHIEVGEYTTAFAYINTLLNIGIDALSRDALEEFKEYITRVYGVTTFVHLQVPRDARRIESSVELFMEHPEYIVLDGEAAVEA
jgi:hypothetical protein